MRAWLVVAGVLLCGCAQGGFDDGGPPGTDSGAGDAAIDGGRRDAGRRDAGVRVDAGRDAGADGGQMGDAGPPRDAGPGMDAGRDAGPSLCDPSPTNMEISEVMVASQTGSGDLGEWFEVHNLTGCPINLTGIVISIGSTHTVMSGLLTAGGFVVFAQSADATENHGLGDDYVYGPLGMSNSGGTLVLTHGMTEIARVAWGSTDHRTGRSRQLGVGTSMGSSLGGSGWCDSTAVYSMSPGGPYLGTPGMINAACP